MPGGYGIFGTPWGGGGTGAGASVAQTSGSGGGYGHDEGPGWGGSNAVADAVNTYQANPTPENQQNAVSAIAQQQYLAGPGGDLTAAQQADIMEGYPSEEVAASVQSGVAGIAQGIQSQIDAQNAAAAEQARIDALPKTGIFGTSLDYLSGMSFPGLTGILKGSQSTDRFFKNLASGKPLTTEDKIILANLIAANKKNKNVLDNKDLKKYLEEYDVSEEHLRNRLDEEVELFEGESLERVEELIENYLAGKPTGLDSLTSMIGDFTGSADKKWNIYEDENWRGDPTTEYGVTLEQLKEQIKPEGMAYLKANRPDLYYSFTQPQTTGGLEELANIPVTREMQDNNPDLAKQIFNARNELDRQWGDQGGQGGGQGIADLSPVAQLAATTTPEEVAAATVPAEVAAATTTPAATTTAAATEPTPFDYPGPHFTSAYPGHYANWGPNYVNQGLGQGPNFDYWNQIARTFPGMT